MDIKGTSALREITYIPAKEEQSTKIRVASYARVSSDSDDQKNSFSSQVSHYTKLIQNEPTYELVDIYADEGISGVSTEKRTEFLRMMEDARNGKIDKIITKSISRFSRNQLDSIIAIRELKSLGVTVVFEKESIDTSKLSSENLLSIFSLLSEQESKNISQNCKKSVRAKMSKGEYIPSNPPFGYRLVDKKFEIYEPEAEIVRRIFSEYINGKGFLTIARELKNECVIKKDNSTSWRKNTVADIIANEKYIGDMLYQKKFHEDAPPYNQKRNKGEVVKHYVKNTHEPIVEEIVYQIANAISSTKKEKFLINNTCSEHFLSKKIKCSDCGTSFRRKENNGKYYWICRSRDLQFEDCSSERLSETQICDAFINLYNKLRKNYNEILVPTLVKLEKLDEIRYNDNLELKNINQEIAKLSEQNHMMTGLMSDGILDSALFIAKTDELNKKIGKLKKSKAIILKNRNSNELIDKTEELIEILEENNEFITEMNEEIFEHIVTKITARDSKTLKFHLINGMVLTEKIKA